MRHSLFTLALVLYSISSFSQGNQKLSDQLWNRVAPCYAMFEDSDNNGIVDYDVLIDDSKNGYLKVGGTYPTCGCYCEHTVGAFKNSFNKYVFLQKSVWSCSWLVEISSSDSLQFIFPIDFEKNGFFMKELVNTEQNATFYLDFEIPQKGTDTKVNINMIPFGLNISSDKSIVYGISEALGTKNDDQFFGISRIVSKIQQTETLDFILSDQFDKISSQDLKYVNKSIGDKSDKFKNKDELIKRLQTLKRKFDLYAQIKHKSLLLAWDRDKGSFYIKSRGESPKRFTFLEFLRNTKYWSPAC